MRVLVACEYSGVVRDAFIRGGVEAMSCDLLPTETPGPHYQGDVRDVLDYPWDLMIAHPPCTNLSVSGAKHFIGKRLNGSQQSGASFFIMLAKSNIPKICLENPVSVMSTLYGKPDQIIQPYQFGHTSRKTTCLWLKGLPKLQPTNIVEPEIYVCKNGKTFSKDYMVALKAGNKRGHLRSKTYQGIADAMADQWVNL